MISEVQNIKFLVIVFIVTLFIMAIFMAKMFWFQSIEVPVLVENPSYRNKTLPIDKRVEDIMSYMTLKEKIGQMTLIEKNSVKKIADISKFGLGGILSGFGAKPQNNTPQGWKDMVREFTEESRDSRLGIPILYGVDAIHGHTNVKGATVFPHSIGLGASRDPELVRAVAAATAEEMKATGIYWNYAPNFDLPKDIRWGRVYETFSDDPDLVSSLGSAYVEGLQLTNPLSTTSVLATLKHYIGAGSMSWNSSSNDNFKIDQGTTPPEENNLRKIYLPPFEASINAGAMSIMVGLNSWGETKLTAQTYLISDVLKKELGFKGFVVSDWYAIYEISDDKYAATVAAINAGIDMAMLPFDYETFIKNVTSAVKNGDIKEERINDAVTRILTVKFALGLFDNINDIQNTSIVGSDEHRELARSAVAKSLVLLKNKNAILPLTSKNSSIRVAGSAAHNTGKQAGAWTLEWQGIDGNSLPGATSILEGIKETAPDQSIIEYEKNALFAPNTPKATVGIAIVGEDPYAEGWGDNPNPSLSAEDIETIKRLRKASEKVVVILITGRPLLITDEIDDWDGVVVAWLPGSEGAGIADVLFNKAPFTGSLPLPWPAELSQLPIGADDKTKDKSSLLFPRYFGLRY